VFHGWDNYFTLTGTASGGLIGLLFVVVTLTAGLEHSRAMRASAIYMTPNMVHFAMVLVSSATAVAPGVSAPVAAVILGVAALLGLSNAARTCLGIYEFAKSGDPPHWSDIWCYGGAPAAIYLALLGTAAAVWAGVALAVDALAALLMILLLVAIRNAWDLITWMAPRAGTDRRNPPQPPGG
jgi:hypothetical protein